MDKKVNCKPCTHFVTEKPAPQIIRGYKVHVTYTGTVEETEQKKKRIAEIILKSRNK